MDTLHHTDGYIAFTAEKPFSFAKHSSIGCGGNARVGYYPKTEEELKSLVSGLYADGTPFYTVGNLTNVLPPDEDTQTVIVGTKFLRDIRADNNEIYVSAGVSSNGFLRECKRLGLGGAEFFAGIPCTIGGALFMNAGAAGQYVAPLVKSVRVLHGNKVETLSPLECAYGYKTSVFMYEKMVILGGTFALSVMADEEIAQRTKYFLQKRAHLPKGKSMGCVFKNPPSDSAGRLIEGAGLKGLRIGGAKIAEQHANFIINENGATATDIKRLITIMKNAVYAQYKVRLIEEIRYIL